MARDRRAADLQSAAVQHPASRRAAKDVLPWCAANSVGAISYSPLFRGLLFGTWSRDKTFGADDARGPHKDYSGLRFQRHLDAVDEVQAIARAGGLSCAQLCVGVLLLTPGLTGVICGARDARQGALVANLGVAVTDEQAAKVWAGPYGDWQRIWRNFRQVRGQRSEVKGQRSEVRGQSFSKVRVKGRIIPAGASRGFAAKAGPSSARRD